MTAAHAFHPPLGSASWWPVLAWQARVHDVIDHDHRACEVTEVTFVDDLNRRHLDDSGWGVVLFLDDLATRRAGGGTGRCETLTVPADEVLRLIGGDPA